MRDALTENDEYHRGPDAWPDDSVLVVVSSGLYAQIIDRARHLPYPVSGAFVAAQWIDNACEQDPTLAERIGW